MQRRFQQLDVFSSSTGDGNPLAVVVDGEGIGDDDMERFARWTNLSETTFLLPPTDPAADYRVRIFTPAQELPFAGHPTLGSCRAWLNTGGVPVRDGFVVQQCGIGLVDLRLADDTIAFAAPPLIASGPVDDAVDAQVRHALGAAYPLSIQWGDNGPGWVVAELASVDEVLALAPDSLGDLKLGVFAAHRDDDDIDHVDYEVRAFFTVDGAVREDPVTGSLNASIAVILAERSGDWQSYRARQGTAMGRNGRVDVERDGERIWVGGDIVTSITGTLNW